jgi:hypothetical protein
MKSILPTSLSFIPLCFLVACNSNLSDSKKTAEEGGMSQNETIMADGSNITGVYAGEMWPINYNLHFKTIGRVAVQRENDNFTASVMMKFGPAETSHHQAIYTGRRCPTILDDLNKDAYIDINEARRVIGKITIPLDGDLDSQLGGYNQNSAGDTTGKYYYQKSASFDRMFADLKTSDENATDDIIKLKQEDGLTFPGRVVVIQGLSEKIPLPATVATVEGESAHQSIPVGCAVLWKVPEMPTEVRPEAEVSSGNIQ